MGGLIEKIWTLHTQSCGATRGGTAIIVCRCRRGYFLLFSRTSSTRAGRCAVFWCCAIDRSVPGTLHWLVFWWDMEGIELESASPLTPLSVTQPGADMSVKWIPSVCFAPHVRRSQLNKRVKADLMCLWPGISTTHLVAAELLKPYGLGGNIETLAASAIKISRINAPVEISRRAVCQTRTIYLFSLSLTSTQIYLI